MRLRQPPVVSVFVRHKQDCPDAVLGEGYAKCMCGKFFRWSADGKQCKRAAGTSFWGVAEKRAEVLQAELTDRWTRAEKDLPIPATPAPGIQAQIESFLATRKNCAKRRLYGLTQQLAKLETFMAARGRSTVAEITSSDVDAFRADWDRYWNSKWRQRNAQAAYKTFLKFANRHDLLGRFETISAPQSEPKPFTAEEIERQLAACPDELTRLWIRTAVGTGAASVDVTNISREALARSNGVLRIRRVKTDKDATPVIHPTLLADLRAALDAEFMPTGRARGRSQMKLSAGRRFVFFAGDELRASKTGTYPDVENWRKKIQRVQEACGLWESGDVCHRYRDSFINMAFDAGYDTTTIADMAGDSVAVIERHYRNWASKGREEYLLSRVVPRQF